MKHGLKVLVGLTFAAAAALSATSAAQAQAIPYPNPGTVNPLTYTVTPTGNTVTFTFYSSSAADTDYVGLFQGGSQVGSWVLNNQTSSQGQSATFNVTAGQPVVLAEWNSTTNTQFFSIPGLNPDGDQHAFWPMLTRVSSSREAPPATTSAGKIWQPSRAATLITMTPRSSSAACWPLPARRRAWVWRAWRRWRSSARPACAAPEPSSAKQNQVGRASAGVPRGPTGPLSRKIALRL